MRLIAFVLTLAGAAPLGPAALEGGGGARPMRLIAFVLTLAGATPLGPAALVFILRPILAVGGASAGEAAADEALADVYNHELTPLQKHIAFFDRDKDGVIYPSETYQGFRAIGCGVGLSAFSAVFIHGLLGPRTVPENMKAPAFKFPIYVKCIHKGKHGSDSGVYDAQGRFVPEKFEEIFKKHAHTRPDALTGKELNEMLQENREPNDIRGRVGGYTEWKLLYSLCKDKQGFLHKETVRAVYDGSLFEKMERERKEVRESAKNK
ncbi:probable peroxygenase 5 [Lolium perenne]|uniref:probable peroxygenase 5 n=1 Tax=Lolium perenne TaxID=4522 RepID=UPI0021F5570B|nr:probable peroxygenase 5 [Lolium perenne]